MNHLIGIDVGTSGVKTIIVNEKGGIAGTAFESYQLHTPKPNWAEQDPADWWRATVATLRQAIETSGVCPDSVSGISLSGQMHSSVMLDENDQVLRPSILWCDTRTSAQCRWITETVGEEGLATWVSNPALEGFTAPKIIWVRENEPDVYDRIRRVVLPKDYIRFLLTGEFAMEVSDAAGTLLFDVQNRCWSFDMMDALGLPTDIMPPVVESIYPCGAITEKVAVDTGLRAGTPVVAGGADNTCGAVGTGIVEPGLVLSSLGTSGVVFAHTDDVKVDPAMRVHSFCHSVPGRWYLMGVTLFAGGSFQWFRNTMGQSEIVAAEKEGKDPYDLLTAEASQAPVGSEGLVFLPYLMGERTPHKDANAKGAYVGITARHERSHMVRAVMEGITFAMKDSLEIMHGLGLDISQIRATGGGARSPLWRQMQADIYGAEVVTVNGEEGPAFGAAILAGVGAGLYSDVESACSSLIDIESRTEPEKENVARYQEQYGVFQSLYPALKPSFDQITEIVKNDAR